MNDIFKDIGSFSELIEKLTPDIYQQLKTAVEIGKWPTGQALSKEQRSLCLQAVIAYEQKNVAETERTGFVPPKNTACGSHDNKPDDEQVITIK